MVIVSQAAPADAAQILELQRRAYASEALLYDDWAIPPLSQSLESLTEEIRTIVVLKALESETLVGSVRAELNNGVCRIGRLVVEPALQRRGIGGILLQSIEQAFPQAAYYELFTGHLSEGNIRLYRRHGYTVNDTRRLSERVSLVFMTKPAVTRPVS